MSGPHVPAATPELPDIFTPAQHMLTLLGLANRALLSRPEDPLPKALALLTDYDMAAVNRVTAVADSEGMYALLDEAPVTFADHLLLGQLVYASPLGAVIAAFFVPDDVAPPEAVAQQRTEILAYMAHHVAWNSRMLETMLLERCPEEYRDDVAQERAELRAAATAAFATWQHTLGALALPAPAPVLPTADAHGWSIEPMAVQLGMLAMAVTMLRLLPTLSQHPFAEAMQHLPDFHPQRLEELGSYLSAAEPDQRLPLSRTQGLLLYVAVHTLMVLFVSDVLDGEGLDDFLLRHQEDSAEPVTPALISQLREATTLMVVGYIEVVRENESDAADFQALEQRLAPVLALAVS